MDEDDFWPVGKCRCGDPTCLGNASPTATYFRVEAIAYISGMIESAYNRFPSEGFG